MRKMILGLSAAGVMAILLLYFQNCSGGSVAIPANPTTLASATSPTPSPTPTGPPTASVSSQTIHPGQSVTVTVSLSNISASYELTWQLSPINTDFTTVSGSLPVLPGQTQASFTLTSTLAPGCGNKSYQIDIAEAKNAIAPVTEQLSLVDTVPAPSVAISVTAGCAAIAGVVKCWGNNNSGQLGNGTTSSSSAPTAVSVLAGAQVTQIAAGNSTACAIQAGSLYCWGNNSSGQVGDGTTSNRTSPVPVLTMSSGVTQVSVGASHTCAIQNGGLFCWGNNGSGQLGNGTTANSTAATVATGMTSGVTWVSAGDSFTCAIQSGAGFCWGLNSSGQLGNGTTTDSSAKSAITGATAGVTQVTAGTSHACMLMSGAMSCWGNNSDGNLGNGTTNGSTTPVQVNLSGVTEIAAGNLSSFAIIGGALTAFGDNGSGQLGIGSTSNQKSPVAAASTLGTSIKNFAASPDANTVCGIAAEKLYCWGSNSSGQVGNGNNSNQTSPVLISF